jgi:GAF domain-containing protein
MKAPIPENDALRLQSLRNYKILDTEPEAAFDDLTRLAAFICGTPIAAVTLVDANRQWFKSKTGLALAGTPRDQAICAHAILGDELFIVADASLDTRFAENELVTGDPGIRFYAGAPLTARDGCKLGTLCVIDQKARELSPEQKEALTMLSRQVMAQLELRRNLTELQQSLAERDVVEEAKTHLIAELERALEQVNTLTGLLPVCAWCRKVRDDHGYWEELDNYVAEHSTATFSHGVCPECAKRYFQRPARPENSAEN